MPAHAKFLSTPNLLTLTRLPLAALLWKAPSKRRWVLGTIAAAGLSDVLDGRAARHMRIPAHPAGVWLDPLCDKIFVLSALAALTSVRKPPAYVPTLIASREILQIPLVTFLLTKDREARERQKRNFKAAPIGKAATCTQFLAIGALLFQHRWTARLAAISGIVGAAASGFYFTRMLSTHTDRARMRLAA